jgi:hypothetical protein
MRCNNCGWNNADDAETCVKCNSPLAEKVRAAAGGAQKETVKGGAGERRSPDGGRARAQDGGGGRPQGDGGGGRPQADSDATAAGGWIECPHCNYPANSMVEDCPSCGKPMKGAVAAGNAGGIPKASEPGEPGQPGEKPRAMRTETIDPFRNRQIVRTSQPEMILEKVGRPDETSELITFKAAGDQVTVNRANLDEGNFTITGKTQATFTFKDNKWWLQDASDLKTTFIQVKEPHELKDGDIILMGDRRFIFYASDAGKTGGEANARTTGDVATPGKTGEATTPGKTGGATP